MLTADGVVKILDFGLAKLSIQTKLTKDGATLGTTILAGRGEINKLK